MIFPLIFLSLSLDPTTNLSQNFLPSPPSPPGIFSYFSSGALPPFLSSFFFPPRDLLCLFADSMPPAAGGPLDRWRVVGIPRCRTHARQPRAPTPPLCHVHAKSELWVKIGRVRKSTFHFQCVLPRALRRAATSGIGPLSSFFRLPYPAAPLFVFGLPHPPPPTESLCML